MAYQHVDPGVVGNAKRVVVSELAGRGNIVYKMEELELDVALSREGAAALTEEIKNRESRGYQYEGAEASFELLVRRAAQGYTPPFELVDYMIMVKQHRRPSEGEDGGQRFIIVCA